jgi:molecular chaperone GrpE (heat shock protein)
MSTNEGSEAAGSEAAESPRRRSPAEAFDELKAAVNRSAKEVSDLWEFAEKVKDKLLQAAEVQRLEGMLPLLDSMLQIHQILFVRLRSAGAKGADDAKDAGDADFVSSLLETLEEELARHGVEIVHPDPGAAFDVHTMDCTQAVEKKSRKDKPNTIAAVNRCGFLYQPPDGSRKRLIAKAQVEVFGK